MTTSETAAGGDAGSGARALVLAPLVLLALFFRDLWYSAHAFSIESADNLDVVYPIFDRFFAELKQGGCREYGKRTLGVLNADGPPRESCQSGRAPQVEIPRGEDLRLHVQADTPAHVILGIHRHPWWEARVAGRPASCAPTRSSWRWRCRPARMWWSSAAGRGA